MLVLIRITCVLFITGEMILVLLVDFLCLIYLFMNNLLFLFCDIDINVPILINNQQLPNASFDFSCLHRRLPKKKKNNRCVYTHELL